jgi:hypothetical protein
VGTVGADAGRTCRFVPLQDDGTPNGAATTVASGACGALRVTPGGFDLVVTSTNPYALSLVATGPSGTPGATAVLASSGVPAASVARASFDDGSFLLAAMPELLSNCECPVEVSVEHFSATGTSLAPATAAAPSWPGAHLALTGLGTTALLATSGSLVGPVTVRELDEDGRAIGTAQALGGGGAPDGGGADVLDIDLAPLGAGALVAWTELTAPGGSDARLLAQAVDAKGVPVSTPIVVAPSGAGRDVRVVGTPSGALITWDGPLGVVGTTPTAVYAAALGCGG